MNIKKRKKKEKKKEKQPFHDTDFIDLYNIMR